MDDGRPDEWQWHLLIEADSLTVSHVCDSTGCEETLSFEPSECAVWCPRCGQGMRIRRTDGWGE